MKKINIAAIAFFLAFISLCFCPWAKAESIPVAEYRKQVDDISAQVESLQAHPENAGKLLVSIPDNVSVKTSFGEVAVNNKPLKNSVAAFVAADEKGLPAALHEIEAYAKAMRLAANTYGDSAASQAAEHTRLEQILARREFKNVRGPTAKDALLSRFYRWLSRLLSGLSSRGGANFDFVRLLIYLFVGTAIALLLVWTVRRFRRPQEELLPREIIPFSPSARGWRTWLGEARALAQQQDWRNAIHLAYWAGIAYLEEHGAWKPNRARTPREYLRLIGTRAAQYPVLSALTRKLETVWYGYGNASEADFQETLGQLEKLGCR
jgi:Domain of unknown function (DUF4129)